MDGLSVLSVAPTRLEIKHTQMTMPYGEVVLDMARHSAMIPCREEALFLLTPEEDLWVFGAASRGARVTDTEDIYITVMLLYRRQIGTRVLIQ
jgi:hypothetical protein